MIKFFIIVKESKIIFKISLKLSRDNLIAPIN